MKTVLALLALLAQPAPAQESRPTRPLPATRADLALALLDFEAALRAYPPAPEQVRALNQAFDQATLLFFRRGGFPQTVMRLRALARPPGSSAAPDQDLAETLRLRLEPAVLLAGKETECTALLGSLAQAPGPDGGGFALRLLAPGGALLAERPWKVVPGEGGVVFSRLSVPLPREGLPAGTYRVELGCPGRPAAAWWPLAVVAEPLEALRASVGGRLERLEPSDPGLAQAKALCQSRVALLTEEPGESRSARLLADLAGLAGEVQAESAALLRGENPYRGRTGRWWCALPAGGGEIPLCVYGPPQAADGKPLPLVIALHGAGGDENLFMAGYGAGRIVELARERGFLVASPEATAFLLGPSNLDRLLAGLGLLYPIDAERIYLLGHSMGAMAASALARTREQRLAAVCCLAGGAFMGGGRCAPALVIAGGTDPLFPARRMEAAVALGRRGGGEIEFRLKEEFGHTLLVGAALPEAVEWLLERRRR